MPYTRSVQYWLFTAISFSPRSNTFTVWAAYRPDGVWQWHCLHHALNSADMLMLLFCEIEQSAYSSTGYHWCLTGGRSLVCVPGSMTFLYKLSGFFPPQSESCTLVIMLMDTINKNKGKNVEANLFTVIVAQQWTTDLSWVLPDYAWCNPTVIVCSPAQTTMRIIRRSADVGIWETHLRPKNIWAVSQLEPTGVVFHFLLFRCLFPISGASEELKPIPPDIRWRRGTPRTIIDFLAVPSISSFPSTHHCLCTKPELTILLK